MSQWLKGSVSAARWPVLTILFLFAVSGGLDLCLGLSVLEFSTKQQQ